MKKIEQTGKGDEAELKDAPQPGAETEPAAANRAGATREPGGKATRLQYADGVVTIDPQGIDGVFTGEMIEKMFADVARDSTRTERQTAQVQSLIYDIATRTNLDVAVNKIDVVDLQSALQRLQAAVATHC